MTSVNCFNGMTTVSNRFSSAGLIAAPLAFRRIHPVSVLASTALLLAIFVLPWAASFDDNSLDPTPSRLSLVVVLTPLLVSVVPATRLPGVGGGAFAVAVVLLGMAMGALPWILDDAMACEDDDCVPLPLAGSWFLVGALWLGLTLECARCHDHKYDPVSQRDYYGLFAFFDQTSETGGEASEGRRLVLYHLAPLPRENQRRTG